MSHAEVFPPARSTRPRPGARSRLLLAAASALGLGAFPPVSAQPVTGSVTAGWAFRSHSGSLGSWKSQQYLGEGFLLEDLSLTVADRDGAERMSLTAWGFGGAEPAQKAHLRWLPTSCWKVDLGYDRRDSALELADPDVGVRTDTWSISRWKASGVYDGLDKARFTLSARYLARTGNAVTPFFGMNEIYPLAVTLDQTQIEGAAKFETKGLGGFFASLEQAVAWSYRKDLWAPGGRGNSANPLVGARSTREDRQVVPTTRAVASWRSERVEVAGGLLYSRPDLDATGIASKTFDLQGGQVGKVEFVDQTVGSATLDTWAANLNAGFALVGDLKLRLLGDLRDSKTDSTLLGQRLLRMTSPSGQTNEVPGTFDNTGLFDVNDRLGRAELAWEARSWAVWAGGFLAQRDVAWKESKERAAYDVERKTAGAAAGASVSVASRLRFSAEYEHGSFESYVFRTDPETVDRLSGKLRADFGQGFSASLRGRWEKGENPPAVAGLDRKSTSGGVGLGWEDPKGLHGVSVDADLVDLHTETGIVFPASGVPTAGTSVYDLSLVTLGASARLTLGPVKLLATGTHLEDRGDTWPLVSWNVSGRLSVKGPATTELSAFVQLFSYDEARADRDDYEVTRYGLLVRWDF